MADDRLRCLDCGTFAPEVQSGEELTFTSASGWRLHLHVDETGKRHPQWRCPTCWKAFKVKRPTMRRADF